jgi:2-polyprenyl-6-methoxyphenol hydroxylase-like FAD-dependent oxidoreductase
LKNKALKVIIVGAGIGGLCLAQGLKKAGISFEVFEKNKDNTNWLEGYRININPIGSNALHRCLPPNLWNAFLAGAGDPNEGIGFMTEQLKELIFIDDAMMVGYTNDAAKKQYAIGRKMLRFILQNGLDKNIFYGKAFTRYEQLVDGKVKVIFDDGTNAIGDILIGADGANSKVRMQLLPGAKRITTNGVAIAGKTLLNDETRGWLPHTIRSRMNVIMPLKKYFFFNAAFDHEIKSTSAIDEITRAAINASIDPAKFFDSSENYILWAFIAHKNEFKQELNNPDADIIAGLLNKIKRWHPGLKRLIQEADKESAMLFQLKVMLPIKNWQTTNITLLGDAVHNMPPVYGMGANMALFDANFLCKQLIRVVDQELELPQALHLFQERMLQDGFKVLNASLAYTKQAIGNNRLQRVFSRCWFKLCAAFPLLKKKSFGTKWDDLLSDYSY